MGSFGDYDTAVRTKAILDSAADSAVNRRRPADRYAIVKSIDEDDRSCQVVFIGDSDDNQVRVPYNSVKPSAIGQAVKVGGPQHDRSIVDTRGPDDAEARIEALESRVSFLEQKAFAQATLSSDWPSVTGAAVKVPINQSVGPAPLNIDINADGSLVPHIEGVYIYTAKFNWAGTRNITLTMYPALLPIATGIQTDIESSSQALLISSAEYTSKTPVMFRGLIYMYPGDQYYVNVGSSSSNTLFKDGTRLGLQLYLPGPVDYPE